ncbi:MAG: helix-turn-helix domain-containing protein [Polyangiaceae bacterium]|nr:helix-turn-helix domain-containing protein [Polyangiaceae bacterium]
MNTHLAPADLTPVPPAPPLGPVRFGQRLQRALQRLVNRMGPPQFVLMDLVAQRWRADALGALVRLGIADALGAGPMEVDALARRLGLHAGATYRLLRALAREGLLVEQGRAFGLSPLTEPLRRDHPHSMANMILELSCARNAHLWARLSEAVQSGDGVWETFSDGNLWTWLDAHPDEHAAFHGAMRELTREGAPSFARAYDFGRHRTVADLGGGTGHLLGAILAVHPNLRGVLVDAAQVVAGAGPVLAGFGVADRCEVVAGDILDGEIPAGLDVYVAKNIAHGVSDALLAAPMRRWRQAMRPDSVLVLIDVVVPPDGPYLGFLDLQMLLASQGGRERTEAEFATLLSANGFALDRVIPTPAPMSLVVARPA